MGALATSALLLITGVLGGSGLGSFATTGCFINPRRASPWLVLSAHLMVHFQIREK
jgi:hypothetical protein